MRGTPATAQHLPVRERTKPDSAVCSSVRASRETVTVAGLRGERARVGPGLRDGWDVRVAETRIPDIRT